MPLEGLSQEERKRLLDKAKTVCACKLMRTKGFELLAKKTKSDRMKQLLLQLSTDEAGHSEFWRERIQELGGRQVGVAKTLLGDRKAGFMMNILGIRGFLEWTLVTEYESINQLAIQAETLEDAAASEIWGRIASDERVHLERTRKEVLGMEEWEIRGGGRVRDMIFGANDGMVSTLAFVAGIVGAITDPSIVLLSGIAELFAGTISMAVGAFQSSKSELEVLRRKNHGQVRHGESLEDEKEELLKLYQAEGFRRGEAEAITRRVLEQRGPLAEAVAFEDLGLKPREGSDPVTAGILCGVSFGLAALVPILPFALPLGNWRALAASVVVTLAALFGVGALKTLFSTRSWIRSGIEMMAIGASAAAITYFIGRLFSMLI